MKNLKVVVTRRWPAEVEEQLAARFDTTLNEDDHPFSQDELQQSLETADAVLPTVCDKLPASLFESGQFRAKFLGNFGVGFNHIDIGAANTAGLTVTNTPGCLTDCTADTAMTLLLSVARRAGEGERQLRSGGWNGWCPTHHLATKVTGKTIGIVGMGRIGVAMAKRCHYGFGMDIVFYDAMRIENDVVAAMGARQLDSVDEVLAASDFVSLHCPGGGDNYHLINENSLRRMKKSAFLINSARGDVVDEIALVDALKQGTIAGAGLDVFENEPDITPDLVNLENVVLLPHLGSATTETRVAMGMMVLENLEAFFNGKEPPNKVG